MPKLFLIPSVLSEHGLDHIPCMNIAILKKLDVFIVEKARTARRFVREMAPDYKFESSHFFELQNKKKQNRIENSYADAFDMGRDVGLLSEAGCPCIADPGSEVVNYAREMGYQIVPLTGPSSIIMALMASGLNGQQFSFHGYLPIRSQLLRIKLKEIEESVIKRGATQIFIETPYRNQSLFDSILK